jgi:peptidyl-prolyl cis-trans isomerase D
MIKARQILTALQRAGADGELHPVTEAEKITARNKIEQAQTRLAAGEEFGLVARELSEDEFSREATAADMPLYVRGQQPKAFDDAAFTQQPGTVSTVVESELGYHLIQVAEQRPAGCSPLAEVAAGLRQHLEQEAIKARLPSFLAQLRRDAAVEILDAALREALPE